MRKNYQVCKERASDDSSISYEKKNKTEKEIKGEQERREEEGETETWGKK